MAKTLVEQAGAVVFRRAGDGLEILLVRAKKTRNQWIFPKGHIEPGESAEDAAVRETREEAGVIGRAVKPLTPPLEFDSGGERVRVRYYLVKATGETGPSEVRDKKWCAPDAAARDLSHDDARDLLRRALPAIRKELP
jgi:8-oxo-dGTP pyrophosphatase MutT (NUDIX family)